MDTVLSYLPPESKFRFLLDWTSFPMDCLKKAYRKPIESEAPCQPGYPIVLALVPLSTRH